MDKIRPITTIENASNTKSPVSSSKKPPPNNQNRVENFSSPSKNSWSNTEKKSRPSLDKKPLGYQIADIVFHMGNVQDRLENLLQELLESAWTSADELHEKELTLDQDIQEKLAENELLHWLKEGARLLFVAAQGAVGGIQGALFGGLLLFSGACAVFASFLSKPECVQWLTSYAETLNVPKEILGIYLPISLVIISVVVPIGVGTGSYLLNGSHGFSANNFMTQLQTLLGPFLSVKQSINKATLYERRGEQTALKEEIDWQEYFVNNTIQTFPVIYSASQTGFKIAADCVRDLNHIIALTTQEI